MRGLPRFHAAGGVAATHTQHRGGIAGRIISIESVPKGE